MHVPNKISIYLSIYILVPVTRIEFGQIKGRGDGQRENNNETVPEETVVHKNSRWDIPRKHALFTSDVPDSTMSGSDIAESHADRPPEVEYSEKLISRRPQDKGGTEGLSSPNMQLEMAVVRLQKDVDDCRTELELARKHTPAVALRPPRRSGFTSRQFQDTPESRTGSSTVRCLKPLYVQIVGTMSLSSGRRCTQCRFASSGVSASGAGIFDEVVIRSLQRPRASGRIQASVSAGIPASGG